MREPSHRETGFVDAVFPRSQWHLGRGGFSHLTVSLEAFNLFDEDTVVQRFENLSAGNAAHIREAISPRVYRLGVRFNWR